MPTSSNLLCGCGRFMRVKKNGVTVEELGEDGAPYKLWDADLFECPECGVEIISGFGRTPMAEHYKPTYTQTRKRLAPIYPGRCAEVVTVDPRERQKGDDDGLQYSDPRDYRDGLE
jgi:hypothetical protein